MFGLIFSVAFLVVALLFMLVGALRGKKTAWQLSVTRIVLSMVSAIIAAFVSSLIAWHGIGAGIDMVTGSMPEIEGIMNELPSGKGIITALAAMIVAPLLFVLVYTIIRLIAKIFTKLIARPFLKLTTPQKKVEVVEVEQEELSPEEKAAEEIYAAVPEVSEASEDPMAKYMNEFVGEASEDTSKKAKKKKKKLMFKLEKNSWIGALCGALCSLVTLCILMVPMVGTLSVVGDMASLPLHAMAESDDSGVMTTVSDVVDGVSNNAGTVTVKLLGGGLLYDVMTTYDVGETKVTLRKEAEFVKTAANAVIAATDKEATKESKVDGIREIAVAFEKSDMLPTLVAELTKAAASDWKEGKDFHGIELPSMGESFDPLMMSLVEAFSESGKETIKDDVATIVEIMAVLMENDALESFSSDPMVMLSKEDTTAEILKNLLENPRLDVMVDGISDFGVSVLMSAVGAKENVAPLYAEFKTAVQNVYGETAEDLTAAYAKVFDTYGLKVTDELCADAAKTKLNGGNIVDWVARNVVADEADYVKKTVIVSVNMITEGKADVQNSENEAKLLAHTYAQAYGLMKKMSDSTFGINDMVAEMGPVLDSFALTESIGPAKTAYILKAMLQSETVHDKIGFSVLEASDSADSISKNAATKSYANMLNSLMLAIDVVEAASDPNVNTSEAVDKMLADLTPESAEVLQTISTPEVMKNYGVPEKSAKPTSELMSDTFGNLADAKENGMSDEEYAKESAAVSNMMSVAMSSKGGAVFGEQSATGITSDQFVDDIMNSTVMSDTLVEKVYGDGDEPKVDPLASGRKMSEAENTSFMTSLNNKWNASDKSESTKKEIVAIASIMNVKVTVTDSGVQQVVDAQ